MLQEITLNQDTLASEGRDITGKVKETVGDITGDNQLRDEGLADQLGGKVQKVVGAAHDALAVDGQPIDDKARRFVHVRSGLGRWPR